MSPEQLADAMVAPWDTAAQSGRHALMHSARRCAKAVKSDQVAQLEPDDGPVFERLIDSLADLALAAAGGRNSHRNARALLAAAYRKLAAQEN